MLCSADGCETEVRRGQCAYHGHKAWQERNRERMRELARRSYEKNKEKRLALTKEYQARTRDQDIARRNTKEARERRQALNRRVYERDPEEAYARVSKRRARLKGAGGHHTAAERRAVKEAFNHTCPACGSREHLQIDHIIPISQGGSDDAWNLQVLCRRCNNLKGGGSFFVAYAPTYSQRS